MMAFEFRCPDPRCVSIPSCVLFPRYSGLIRGETFQVKESGKYLREEDVTVTGPFRE